MAKARHFLTLFAACLAAGLVTDGAARGEPAGHPNYWDPHERVVRPDLSARPRIRFLTTNDFPPFNFIDWQGRLSGFHVDLAREICDVLAVADRCEIQVLPWDRLGPAMARGEGEAIIAGLAISPASREKYLFTRSFLKFPARFVRADRLQLDGADVSALAGRRVGVRAGTAHEAMLRAWFPAISPVTFERDGQLFDAVIAGEVDAAFGDGIHLSFWLASGASGECCSFFGGPYFAPAFLGHGLAIAVSQDSPDLRQGFDHALHAISRSGQMRALSLRVFPNRLR